MRQLPPISILGMSVLSAEGVKVLSRDFGSYSWAATGKFESYNINSKTVCVAPLGDPAELEVSNAISRIHGLRDVDRTAQMAAAASLSLGTISTVKACIASNTKIPVIAASSRGATGVWESAHEEFIKGNRIPVATSPLTTLGNISSWVAESLGVDGYDCELSVTCSSGLHALVHGWTLIASGMCEYAVVVGVEAPLTPFTIAQMEALRIYSGLGKDDWPCRPFGAQQIKRNTLVLGEASCAMLIGRCDIKNKSDALAVISGLGCFRERANSPTAISDEGIGFNNSIQLACGSVSRPDLIVAHAPGTLRGDAAETYALCKVFEGRVPFTVSNKCYVGHTFACSGLLSLEYAVSALNRPKAITFPNYEINAPGGSVAPSHIDRVLVNSAGFGGNHVSLLVINNNSKDV